MVWMDPVILVRDTGRLYMTEHCCTYQVTLCDVTTLAKTSASAVAYTLIWGD